MRTDGYTHDIFTSVRPSRSCSQFREAKAELVASTESDCASWGLAMVGYAILTLSHELHNYDITPPYDCLSKTTALIRFQLA